MHESRADRAEDVGRLEAVVAHGPWPSAGREPTAWSAFPSGRPGLRPGTRFRGAPPRGVARGWRRRRLRSFFERLLGLWVGFGMDRTGLEVGQLHPMQTILHAAARIIRSEVLGRDLADVTNPEFDDAVPVQIGTRCNERGQFLFQFRRQEWWTAGMGAIPQPLGPFSVVADHPVAQRLPVHPPAPGRLSPAGPVQRHRFRQKPPDHAAIAFAPSLMAKLVRRQIRPYPKRGHGDKIPSLVSPRQENHTDSSAQPSPHRESAIFGPGISALFPGHGTPPTKGSVYPRFTAAGHGAASKRSSSPRSNGSTGSTTGACSSRSETSRPPRPRPASTPPSPTQRPWRHERSARLRKDCRVLGGVKASTPQAARALLDPACDSRRSETQVGAEEWSFGLTKECWAIPHHSTARI